MLKDGDKWRTQVVHTLEQAKLLEAKLKTEAFNMRELGIIPAPEIQTVWEKYHQHLKLNTKSEAYYGSFWRNHISPVFEGRKLSDITVAELDSFVAQLKEKTHTPSHNSRSKLPKPLKPATIVNILMTIRRLFTFAASKGLYTGANPTKYVSITRHDNRRTDSLTNSELTKLIHVLKTWPNRMAALGLFMCLATGKRAGEVFGLTWSAVNFESHTLRFKVKSRVRDEYQTLPMGNLPRQILLEAGQHTHAKSQLVFHTRTGRKIHYESTWERIKASAGVRPEIRVHDLRHTFATRLASSGEVDIYTLQNLLGHKTIAMTQRYAHLLDERLRQSLAVADKIFA